MVNIKDYKLPVKHPSRNYPTVQAAQLPKPK